MASLYTDTTTEVYGHLRNDSMNNLVHDNSDMTSSFYISGWDILNFILFTVVAGPMCVIGFIANIICCKVLKMDSGKKHHAATFLLQALAVADNLVLTLFFFNASIITGLLPMLGSREKIMSEVIYAYIIVYVTPFVNMAMTATVWITVLIAINRYIAVCHPLDAHRLASLKRTKIQVAVVFILAISVSLPLFFSYTIVYPETSSSMTVPYRVETSIGPNTLFGTVYRTVFDNIGLMILPLILLIILNTRIIWELRKADNSRDAIRQNGSRSENNITKVMVVIIIVFIVCNIPFHIYVLAIQVVQYNKGWHALYPVSQVLLAANSSTNFVVYYVLRKSFRRAFRKALCCCQPQALVV